MPGQTETQAHGAHARGGCQCGGLRFVVSSPPLLVYACHCSGCQRQSGSAFGMSMVVRAADFIIERGEPRVWRRTTSASGRTGLCLFCPDCGSRIAHKSEDPEHPSIVLKPGTLDDTSTLFPCAHFWVSRAQPWTAPIRRGGLEFDEQPADFEPVRRAWSERQDALERAGAG